MAGNVVHYFQPDGPNGPIHLQLSASEARLLGIQLLQQATQLLQQAERLDNQT